MLAVIISAPYSFVKYVLLNFDKLFLSAVLVLLFQRTNTLQKKNAERRSLKEKMFFDCCVSVLFAFKIRLSAVFIEVITLAIYNGDHGQILNNEPSDGFRAEILIANDLGGFDAA